MKYSISRRGALAALLCGTALTSALATPVFAQDATAGAPSALPEVVVTGSRIARRDFVSASPLATVSTEALRGAGHVNLDTALAQLPQFTPTTGGGNQLAGAGTVATINLRGLGAQRNLILLDGRRLPFSNSSNVVDINIFPQSIVENVEIITGGASAVYGSDAISGVVNFKTRRHFDGVQLSAQSGISERGDAKNTDLSVLVGRDFMSHRGNVLLSAGYSHRGRIDNLDRVPTFLDYGLPLFTTGQAAVTATNLPSQAAVNAVFAKYGIAAGSVPVTSALGFNNDGTLFSVIGGRNLKDTRPYEFSLAGGVLTETTRTVGYLTSPQDRYNLFGRVTFDLTDNIHLYAQGIGTETQQYNKTIYNLGQPPYAIPVTNPFIPQDLRQVLASRPVPNAPFVLNKSHTELGTRDFDDRTRTYQLVVGAKGELGVGEIKWDGYYAHSESHLDSTLRNAILLSRLTQLFNAPDGGASICAGGYNPFGLAQGLAVSPECVRYVSTSAYNSTDTRQNVAELTVGGALFKLPADRIRYSITGAYRDDGLEFHPDPRNRPAGTADPDGLGRPAADLVGGGQTVPFPVAQISVKEIAGDLLIPLLRDQPFAKSLNVTLGGRYSDYSTVGGVKSYKAETDYRIVPALMIRGGYERAVRAANFVEALSPATGTAVVLGAPPAQGDPCDPRTNARARGGAALRQLCLATGVPAAVIDTGAFGVLVRGSQSGDINVKPETADTYTLGAVFTPRFGNPLFDGLSLSVDYYAIDIRDVISAISGVSVIGNCYNQDGVSNPSLDPTNPYCRVLTRDAGGNISGVVSKFQNLGGLKTTGVDAQASWTYRLDNGASIDVNTYVNYLIDYSIQVLPGKPFIDYAGLFSDATGVALNVSVPHPTWKTNSTVRYRTETWDAAVQWRHLSSMKDLTSVTAPATPLPKTKSYDVFDLIGNYRIRDDYTVSVGVNNLFDRKPNESAQQPGIVLPQVYDLIGRRYYLGVKASF